MTHAVEARSPDTRRTDPPIPRGGPIPRYPEGVREPIRRIGLDRSPLGSGADPKDRRGSVEGVREAIQRIAVDRANTGRVRT